MCIFVIHYVKECYALESEGVVEGEFEAVSAVAGEPLTPSRAWEARLFELMAKGLSLREACRQPGMPCHQTVYNESYKDNDFAQRLRKAREACMEAKQDELDELKQQATEAKPEHVPGLRLASDILKFQLVKVLKPIYGDAPAQVNIDNRTQVVVLSDEKRAELQDRLKRLQLGEKGDETT